MVAEVHVQYFIYSIYIQVAGYSFKVHSWLCFRLSLLQQARSLLTLATCHSPPPMKTVLCESLSSVCIVGFMYFTELRSCSLTLAQVRKEQDGLVHQADCSFLPRVWVGGWGLLGGEVS